MIEMSFQSPNWILHGQKRVFGAHWHPHSQCQSKERSSIVRSISHRKTQVNDVSDKFPALVESLQQAWLTSCQNSQIVVRSRHPASYVPSTRPHFAVPVRSTSRCSRATHLLFPGAVTS